MNQTKYHSKVGTFKAKCVLSKASTVASQQSMVALQGPEKERDFHKENAAVRLEILRSDDSPSSVFSEFFMFHVSSFLLYPDVLDIFQTFLRQQDVLRCLAG